MQNYTSANTSINSTKLPRLYTLAEDTIKGKKVIDYGCGKFFDSYLDKVDADLYGYDPYNRNDESVLADDYDVAICSNVLNVIDDFAARAEVLGMLRSLAPTVLISVYEGNRSGIGKATKKDCYQLNRSCGDYIPELVAVFGKGNVTFKRGYFECRGYASGKDRKEGVA